MKNIIYLLSDLKGGIVVNREDVTMRKVNDIQKVVLLI